MRLRHEEPTGSRREELGSATSTLSKLLLVSGIASSALYVAMLLFVPLGWPAYESASRTVSELSAIGAPTRALWVALGRLWTLLYAAFGWGIWRSARGSGALRIVGASIIASAIFGAFWPPMHQREVLAAGGGTLTDTLHIVWTAVNGALTLLAMSAGAAALGRRFRAYSIVSIVIVIAAAALTSLDAPRVDADLPTPWVGVWERINIGAWLLWVAALAATLLRQAAQRATSSRAARPSKLAVRMDGFVAAGFEAVRSEFERNFSRRGDFGAAVAAYWCGKKVVDLWGGYRTPEGDPWNEDTMVMVMSTTKGLSAMTLALANARGWLDYDAPVSSYWPEFAQNGKGDVTVRQLLGHAAGLVLLDESLTVEKLRDLDGLARILARQTPNWPPGTRHGYHTMTLGFYMQELMRRVDPAHRSLGRVFREEIAAPLGLDFHIGLPPDTPDERLAWIKTLSPWSGLLALRHTSPATTLRMIMPGTLLRRSFVGVKVEPSDRAYLEAEVPAGNGVGTARSIARAYSVFAEGGAELGITSATMARITASPEAVGHRDAVLGVPTEFSLGFSRPGPSGFFGASPRAFGAPGAGGSFGFADPDVRLGFAYVTNKLGFYLVNDPREKSLRDAVYDAIARLTSRRRDVRVGPGDVPSRSPDQPSA